jgi:hypothetical protein
MMVIRIGLYVRHSIQIFPGDLVGDPPNEVTEVYLICIIVQDHQDVPGAEDPCVRRELVFKGYGKEIGRGYVRPRIVRMHIARDSEHIPRVEQARVVPRAL